MFHFAGTHRTTTLLTCLSRIQQISHTWAARTYANQPLKHLLPLQWNGVPKQKEDRSRPAESKKSGSTRYNDRSRRRDTSPHGKRSRDDDGKDHDPNSERSPRPLYRRSGAKHSNPVQRDINSKDTKEFASFPSPSRPPYRDQASRSAPSPANDKWDRRRDARRSPTDHSDAPRSYSSRGQRGSSDRDARVREHRDDRTRSPPSRTFKDHRSTSRSLTPQRSRDDVEYSDVFSRPFDKRSSSRAPKLLAQGWGIRSDKDMPQHDADKPRHDERASPSRPPATNYPPSPPTSAVDDATDGSSQTEPLSTSAQDDEVYTHGIHAVLALAKVRPSDVVRTYTTQELMDSDKRVSGLLYQVSQARKPYFIVKQDDLARMARSAHHEGLIMLAKRRPVLSLDEAIAKEMERSIPYVQKNSPLSALGRKCMVVLDRILNPHNMGAILRACALFGVHTVISVQNPTDQMEDVGSSAARYDKRKGAMHTRPAGEQQPTGSRMYPYSPAVMRTSAGAGEHITLVPCTHDQLRPALKHLQANKWRVVSTSPHHSSTSTILWTKQTDAILNPPANIILIMGSEMIGVDPQLARCADASIRIPSSGTVESFNVSQAAALILGEVWRLQGGSSYTNTST
eukprot:TRINITY_DN8775_c0_g1_i2.p1 TRINITY_DN8775_c0_g1~~TRINITY_DN8775_c0_g1_i2.p1  ORF type:complete len:639 (+),score=105.87 TRINITY_DN8775_c0_g1_i2:41-1918(+)